MKHYANAVRSTDIKHCGCIAHARRRFFEAQKVLKGKDKKGSTAYQGLIYINKLYAVERECKGKTREDIARIREQKSKPLIAAMRAWMNQTIHKITPQSLTGKALHYLNSQWHKLMRYADDGISPIDNNFMENKIRLFAIGRKNWMFAATPQGAEASAAIYSLIQTAKTNGLDLQAYLDNLITKLPLAKNDGELRELLPFK